MKTILKAYPALLNKEGKIDHVKLLQFLACVLKYLKGTPLTVAEQEYYGNSLEYFVSDKKNLQMFSSTLLKFEQSFIPKTNKSLVKRPILRFLERHDNIISIGWSAGLITMTLVSGMLPKPAVLIVASISILAAASTIITVSSMPWCEKIRNQSLLMAKKAFGYQEPLSLGAGEIEAIEKAVENLARQTPGLLGLFTRFKDSSLSKERLVPGTKFKKRSLEQNNPKKNMTLKI